MELIAFILGCIGGVIIGTSWNDVLKELKRIAKALRNLAELTFTSSRLIIRRAAEGVVEIVHTILYKNAHGKYDQNTTIIRDIEESQLPDWARAELNAQRGDVDITQKSREVLELTL